MDWFGVRTANSRRRPVRIISRGTVRAHAELGIRRWMSSQVSYDKGVISHGLIDAGVVDNLQGSMVNAAYVAIVRHLTPDLQLLAELGEVSQ